MKVRFDNAVLDAFSKLPPKPGIPSTDVTRHRMCPRPCGQVTHLLNYAFDSGIIINRCPDCYGLWLDDMELESVQKFVEAIERELKE